MDKRMLGLSLLLATSAASAETIPSLIGPVSDIVVVEDRIGPERENCQNFKVSETMSPTRAGIFAGRGMKQEFFRKRKAHLSPYWH